ncbi:MAG: ABC transporter ATP-binding protein [Hyphomicrobiales bacterium]|nr:ABC transporter ATP-binding protein [Hyphomicrobiales bacterium]
MSLTVQGVSVSLGPRRALADVSFAAPVGQLLALVGPNGAGKTTLLRAIAALIRFDGAIAWEGRSLASLPARERARQLAYLPQGHVAHWPITARQTVAIGRAPHASSLGRLHPEDDAAIDAALAQTRAAEFADRRVTELSGGERARVMLARALAVGAPVLLADEPTASLDPAHQLSVMALLREVARGGRLVIAVVHDLTLAARFADAALVLDAGRVAAYGPVAEALKPAVVRGVFRVECETITVAGTPAPIPFQALD